MTTKIFQKVNKEKRSQEPIPGILRNKMKSTLKKHKWEISILLKYVIFKDSHSILVTFFL